MTDVLTIRHSSGLGCQRLRTVQAATVWARTAPGLWFRNGEIPHPLQMPGSVVVSGIGIRFGVRILSEAIDYETVLPADRRSRSQDRSQFLRWSSSCEQLAGVRRFRRAGVCRPKSCFWPCEKCRISGPKELEGKGASDEKSDIVAGRSRAGQRLLQKRKLCVVENAGRERYHRGHRSISGG